MDSFASPKRGHLRTNKSRDGFDVISLTKINEHEGIESAHLPAAANEGFDFAIDESTDYYYKPSNSTEHLNDPKAFDQASDLERGHDIPHNPYKATTDDDHYSEYSIGHISKEKMYSAVVFLPTLSATILFIGTAVAYDRATYSSDKINVSPAVTLIYYVVLIALAVMLGCHSSHNMGRYIDRIKTYKIENDETPRMTKIIFTQWGWVVVEQMVLMALAAVLVGGIESCIVKSMHSKQE